MPSVDAGELTQRLNWLRGGERTVQALIAFGSGAIEPLKRFLFEGRPGVTFQPRQWAVHALAGLGARDVLIDYLKWQKNIADPPTRLAEEAVEITAARALKAWPGKNTTQVLLDLAQSHLQPGLVDTLGDFKCVRAIPYFIRALEDDVCRASAIRALSKLGGRARSALIKTSQTPYPSVEEESPSSRIRRRNALALLAEIDTQRRRSARVRKAGTL